MNNFAEKAMLVRLKKKSWTASKPMPSEAVKVEERNNGKQRTASVYVKLMKCDALNEFEANYRAAKEIWIQYTMPWLDGGIRVLPSELYFDFQKAIKPYLEKSDEIVEKFIKVYPDERDFMLNRKSAMYQPADYPDVDELRERFSLRVGFFPIPNSEDWRIEVSDEDKEEIKQEMEKQLLEAQTEAMKDVGRRLAKCIEHIHERLDGDKTFRDSMLGNARELLNLMPKLNFMNDIELDEIRKEAEASLLKYTAQQLRTNSVARNDTAKKADKLLKRVNAYVGGDTDAVDQAAA